MIALLLTIIVTLLAGPLAYVALNRTYRHETKNWPVGIIDGFGDSVLLPWFNATAVHLGILGLLGADALKLIAALLLAYVLTHVFVYWRKDLAAYDDWTRPRKGRFNAAGWYHAGFMFVQSFFIFLSLLHLWRSLWVWLPFGSFCLVVLVRFAQVLLKKHIYR